MKNILFATTALVATAGIASADVALSGFAEMGVVGGNATETQFHQDIDVTFSMSGETDGGLSFGAAIDLDETAEATDTTDDQGTSVFIKGGFGSLTMGDTDGAMDWALTEAGNMGNGGSIADNETSHAGYMGSYLDGNEDGQILRYDYSFGAFGVAASVEMDETAPAASGAARNTFTDAGVASTAALGTNYTESGDTSVALGVNYKMDMGGSSLTLGAGYQNAADRVAYVASSVSDGTTLTETVAVADTTATGISAVYAANGLTVGVNMTEYSDYAGINAVRRVAGTAAAITTGALTDATHTSIGIGYTTGALTLHANYGELDYDNAAIADVDGYGVSVAYDLGGGAAVKAGMNDNDTGADWSLGLAMSF